MTYVAVAVLCFYVGWLTGLEQFTWIARAWRGKSAVYIRDWKLSRDERFIDDLQQAINRAWERR